MFDGGCYYYGGTLENYGNVNSANSLAAIKKGGFRGQERKARKNWSLR